jgi:hypothetical protein
MVRRAGQAGYHYSATHENGRAPSVGERIDLVTGGCLVRFAVTEVFKDRLVRGGIELFTVMADETETITEACPKAACEGL